MSEVSDLQLRLRRVFGLHLGWLTFISALGLTAIGIAAIGTADIGSATHYAFLQSVWLLIAVIVMALCILPHPRQVSAAAYPLLVVSLVLLVVLLVPGAPRWLVERRNGARAWLNLHFMSFQPAEVAKIAFVMAMAHYLRFRDNYRTLAGLLLPFSIMLIPMLLIVVEPDLGMALLFPPTLFVMLVAAGAKLRHMGTLLAIGLLLVALNVVAIYKLPESMQVLRPHQRARITSMISQVQGESRYIRSIGYQQHKAVTLVGAGGLTGYGAQQAAVITKFNHLPEDHNDMIFAVIVDRWGLEGGVGVLCLYLLLVGSFVLIAMRSKDPFTRLTMVGLAGMLFSQAVINIAMCIGLMPITGITLPLISYGGTSLATTFAIIGLAINFASRRPAIVARPSFEYDHADAIYQ